MKKIILLALAAMAFQLHVQAQDQTLFNRAGRFGIFVSPIVEQGPINDPWETSSGGGFGFVLGDAFLGFYGMAGLDYEQLIAEEELDRVDLVHGGLWLGFTPFQESLIHPYGSVRAGWGAINIDVDEFGDDFFDPNDPFNIDDNDVVDNIFALTPEAGLEVNVTRWLRVAATGGYRWVYGVNTPAISEDDFSGWTGALTLRIGWFGRNRNCRRGNW
jgi:opacity protein-like surface antigen